jgi:hypothetical protein
VSRLQPEAKVSAEYKERDKADGEVDSAWNALLKINMQESILLSSQSLNAIKVHGNRGFISGG